LQESAFSIGIAGAALGSFLFVFGCPHSDPFYVVIWFMLSGAIVGVCRVSDPAAHQPVVRVTTSTGRGRPRFLTR
jgi:hypothetical protein